MSRNGLCKISQLDCRGFDEVCKEEGDRGKSTQVNKKNLAVRDENGRLCPHFRNIKMANQSGFPRSRE